MELVVVVIPVVIVIDVIDCVGVNLVGDTFCARGVTRLGVLGFA